VISPNFFEADLHTPGVARKLEYAAAVLVSPSGGIFVYWPAACVLLLAACLLALARRRAVDRRPALVLVAVIVGLTLGFASWWTPFGWGAYGPRLALPWGLPLVLLALVAYGDELGRLVRPLLERLWLLVLVAAALFVLTLPNIGQTWRPNQIGGFFQDHALCDAPWRGGVAEFHACEHDLIWFQRPMPLYAARGVDSPGGVATAVLVGLALLGCLLLLREDLRRAESTAGLPTPLDARNPVPSSS
jgi:hypothetical protein